METLGLAHGVPQAVVQKNGDMVRLAPGPAEVISHEQTGRLVLDGDVILPADGSTINERRKMSFHGQISLAVARKNGARLSGDPQLRLQGVPLEEDRESFLAEARAEVAETMKASGNAELETLREKLRLTVRRVATRWTGKKPVVDVLIVDI